MNTRSEMRLCRIGVLCLLSSFIGTYAYAELSETFLSETFYFAKITGDTDGICPDDFTVNISQSEEIEKNQVLFTFTNNCDDGGVLTRLFFMDNKDLMDFVRVYDQPDGVSFSDMVKEPSMLPGGAPLGFDPHNTYSINADPARPHNGLHFQEFVSILFEFDPDIDPEVMFSNITDSVSDGTLGLGLHTQSLPGGGSASFSTVPEPMTLALLGIGGIFLSRNRRRGTAQ